LDGQIQADKVEHLEQMRLAARLHNEAISFTAQLESLRREQERLRQKTAQAADHLSSLELDLEQFAQAHNALHDRLTASRQAFLEQKQEREQLGRLLEQTQQTLGDLRSQRTHLAGRIDILEGLERSHEGLGSGAREVFALIEQTDPGPWRTVIGMVADLLSANRDYAPLIDLALGERSQHFLVRDIVLLEEALQQLGEPVTSRVSFLAFPVVETGRALIESGNAVGRASHPGVIGRADQMVVSEDPGWMGLAQRLLGQTLIVRDLRTAREITGQL